MTSQDPRPILAEALRLDGSSLPSIRDVRPREPARTAALRCCWIIISALRCERAAGAPCENKPEDIASSTCATPPGN